MDTLLEKNSTPPWLVEHEFTLEGGRKVIFSYDKEGDILEIFFTQGKGCGVDLTDNIVLRYDLESGEPPSLILISFSGLARRGEFGPLAFRLTGLEALPPEIRQTVQRLLTTPPVSKFLKVISYVAPDGSAPIPLAYLEIPFTPKGQPVPELETTEAFLATENTEDAENTSL